MGDHKCHGTEAENCCCVVTVLEAAGIALAGKAVGLPIVISFTVETDGRLPTGQTLGQAILETDEATGGIPVYYMVNCAHPDHFRDTLELDAKWVQRVRGILANASRQSHAQLDQATELDSGNPVELGAEYVALRARHPQINVFAGCCGTDDRHIDEISAALSKASRPNA